VPPWRAPRDSEAEEADAAAAAAAATAAAGTAAAAASVAAALERQVIVGLTPDWVTDACCDIFGLTRPSVASPIVAGLLDPCCNNKRCPNIPAQRLYDKADDGLSLRNSWGEGCFALLNPPYESALQWRFINRAIDEVEWRRCAGVLLVCRNSTDTGYFQRLRPYPRVLLRRDAIRFKDYPSGTPIACASSARVGACMRRGIRADVSCCPPARPLLPRSRHLRLLPGGGRYVAGGVLPALLRRICIQGRGASAARHTRGTLGNPWATLGPDASSCTRLAAPGACRAGEHAG
jgi:hypothetical protein